MVEANHEYIECYAKSINATRIKRVIKIEPKGNYQDEKGSYKRELLRQWGGQHDRPEDRPHMYFPITAPDGTEVYPKRADGSEGVWRFGEGTVQKMLQEKNVDFVKDENNEWGVYRKIREGRESMSAATSILLDYCTSARGTI